MPFSFFRCEYFGRISASAARKDFKKTFVCLEPITDYFRPLSDYIEAPAPIAPVVVEPEVVVSNAPQLARYESSPSTPPAALFSSQVIPYAGDE